MFRDQGAGGMAGILESVCRSRLPGWTAVSMRLTSLVQDSCQKGDCLHSLAQSLSAVHGRSQAKTESMSTDGGLILAMDICYLYAVCRKPPVLSTTVQGLRPCSIRVLCSALLSILSLKSCKQASASI